MNTAICRVESGKIDTEIIQRAGKIISEGGLVAFPTETVYGLGGDAFNPESSRKIYAAKGRPSDNPLIVHICREEDLAKLVCEVPEKAQKLMEAFWPGPLTLIMNKKEEVPLETTGGLNTVAVRLPSDEVARAFIQAAGGYVAAPSANISGRPSPTCGKYVKQDMDGRIDMILYGDDSNIGLESTIVDMTGDVPMILRPGYITKSMIEEVIGVIEMDQTILDDNSKAVPKAPGMKYRHYAPKGQLVVVEGESSSVIEYINTQVIKDRAEGYKTGVISTSRNIPMYKAELILDAGDLEKQQEIAHRLFTILRTFDDENVDRIYSESFADDGLGTAVMNRLLKAAGHNVVVI